MAAASEEFLEHGYAASMEAIAQRAGVSKKTIYRFVETKSDLLIALMAAKAESLRLSIGLNRTDVMGAQETLELILGQYARQMMSADTVAMHRVVAAECLRFPHLAETFYRDGWQRAFGIIACVLKDLEARGLLMVANRARAAAMLVEMIVGEPLRCAVFGVSKCPDEDEIDRRVKEGITLFLHGCAVERQSDLQ